MYLDNQVDRPISWAGNVDIDSMCNVFSQPGR